jgi:hypothetical protein
LAVHPGNRTWRDFSGLATLVPPIWVVPALAKGGHDKKVPALTSDHVQSITGHTTRFMQHGHYFNTTAVPHAVGPPAPPATFGRR